MKFKSNRKLNGWSNEELEEYNSICKDVFCARQNQKRIKMENDFILYNQVNHSFQEHHSRNSTYVDLCSPVQPYMDLITEVAEEDEMTKATSTATPNLSQDSLHYSQDYSSSFSLDQSQSLLDNGEGKQLTAEI